MLKPGTKQNILFSTQLVNIFQCKPRDLGTSNGPFKTSLTYWSAALKHTSAPHPLPGQCVYISANGAAPALRSPLCISTRNRVCLRIKTGQTTSKCTLCKSQRPNVPKIDKPTSVLARFPFHPTKTTSPERSKAKVAAPQQPL
jgi:hypothetical protein